MTREELEAAVAAGKDLRHANLADANLADANLTGANLEGANLEGANLEGADLTGANLYYANLRHATLRGANLRNANLRHAKLTGATLEGADLRGAKLSRANLAGADLFGAFLHDASLRGATLRGADLFRATLERADLARAKLFDANLFGANLKGADLTGANLEGASLRGADLTDANLEGIEFDGNTTWPDNFKSPAVKTTATRSYGRKSAALLKLRKPETPRGARDFKRLYPSEFEALKSDTQGRDFSDKVVAELLQRYETPFEWLITTGKFRSDAQRRCPVANDVFKLNADISQYTPRQQEILKAFSNVSRRSSHPSEPAPLFTIGWVRYCADDAAKTWLIEEVQSDLQGIRKGVENADARRQLESGGIPPEDATEALDLLKPYADRFYEDAIGIVFGLAAQKGYRVEMLAYEDKREYSAPMRVYTDLPKSMGMRMGKGSAVLPGLAETWQITPNRRRRTSRPARKTSRSRR